MAWNWKIQKAAVEQEILFPSETSLNEYIRHLAKTGITFQVVSKCTNSDGTVVAIMRKQYNNNRFLLREETNYS